jgi:transcriptional regulator
MYTPQHFEITDRDTALAFIKVNGFGQLISTVNGRLFSSHLPFYLAADGLSLMCHVAKKNPQWQEIEQQQVLISFQGPHDYVSPSWYNTPGVPTWNYQAVHVYGRPRLIQQREKLEDIIAELTRLHESAFEKPWTPEYSDALLDAIVGIEIPIDEIQCKYKLGQNRPQADRRQVSDQLERRGSVQLAQAMKDTL